MIKRMAAKAVKYAKGLVKRFFTDSPQNGYESIIFAAMRSAAIQFGRFA